MRLNFLKAEMPLTKTYETSEDGKVLKTPYPNAYLVTSLEEQCQTITDLYTKLLTHSTAAHCLLKGMLTHPLVNESRAGTTNAAEATEWLCLDFDGIPDTYLDTTVEPPIKLKVTPDLILKMMGLEDMSYVLQWSASHNITSTNVLRFHIFVLLSRAVSASIIKQWLIQMNHSIPLLAACRALTKTGHALTWGLDITTCQNDKLIYIAPPILKKIRNPLGRQARITLITKAKSVFVFPPATNSAEINRELTTAHVNALREEAGYPSRKFTYKHIKTTEVMVKPDVCTITEIRTERGFTYFNLNGGDSWAYYHPEDRPEVIFNFKGEPNYLTKELLPDYWEQLTSQASRTSSTGVTYLAFLDRRSGVYHRGTFDQATDALDLAAAKNETQIRHFAEQFGVPLGSYIPEWEMVFDPHSQIRVDSVNRVINTFQLTEYMRATPKKTLTCPPTILRIIDHALGNDPACTAHFMNWIAYILQNRAHTLTAWVMHGTEGTGKGILMNRILRPIFGRTQTTSRRMEELNEPYNAYMKECFLVFVDEVEAKSLINERGVMAKLRSFITENTVTVRQMYANAVEWTNYTNWIFASNKPEPVIIPKEDRRFNVGKYQPSKLGMTDAELDLIPDELQAFHDYLHFYNVDAAAASTPLDNADRAAMINISESSIDTVAGAILAGDFEFLLDQLPSSSAYTGNANATARVADYKHALKTIMLRTDTTNGKCNISRDELRVIFEYVVGKIPESPNKFTSLLKHHRIITSKVWVDAKPVYGIKTEFKDVSLFGSYSQTYFPSHIKAVPPAAPAPAPTTVIPIGKGKR